MGWCHEFGVEVHPGCHHPMRAGPDACSCPECQTVCTGHFGGCSSVWARGPVEVTLSPSPSVRLVPDDPVAGDPADEPLFASSPPVPGPRIGLGGSEGARTEVLDWMRAAFESLRRDIRVLNDTVARQQSTLAELAEAGAAETRVLDLADSLPDRLGGAIAAAIEARQNAYVRQVDDQVSRLATQLAVELPRRLGTAIADAIEERHDVLLRRVEEATAELRKDLVAEVVELVLDTRPSPSTPGATPVSLEQAVTGAVDHVLHRAESRGRRPDDGHGTPPGPAQLRSLRERRDAGSRPSGRSA